MIGWLGWALCASGAELEIPMEVSLRIGEPASGRLSLTVPLPSRIPRTEPVATETEGFELVCSGRKRDAIVELSFDLPSVPAQLPQILQCPVGPHQIAIRLSNAPEEASPLGIEIRPPG